MAALVPAVWTLFRRLTGKAGQHAPFGTALGSFTLFALSSEARSPLDAAEPLASGLRLVEGIPQTVRRGERREQTNTASLSLHRNLGPLATPCDAFLVLAMVFAFSASS